MKISKIMKISKRFSQGKSSVISKLSKPYSNKSRGTTEYINNDIDSKRFEEFEKWRTFLKRHRAHDDAYTHVSQRYPMMRLNVSSNMEDEFYKAYNAAMKAGIKTGIAEAPVASPPVLIDFDWRFSKDKGIERIYTNEDINLLAKCIRDSIKELYEDVIPRNLYCIVLEKGTKMREYDENRYKDGWHLHFPCCRISNLEQQKTLRKKVLSLIQEREIFKNIMKVAYNTIEDAYDDKCPNLTWLMYGSNKDKEEMRWCITRCMNYKGNVCPLSEIFGEGGITSDELPRLMSVNRPDIPVLQLKQKYSNTQGLSILPKKPILSEQEKKQVKEVVNKDMEPYLKLIKQETWDTYSSWIELGWTIYTLTKGSDSGLNLWKKYSKKSSKYDEIVLDREWDRMRIGKSTIGTIKWHAQKDNPKKYLKYINRRDGDFERMLKECNSYDIAKYIYSIYDTKYVCVDKRKNVWYRFEDHKWQEDDQGNSLENLLATDVVQMIFEKKKTIQDDYMLDRCSKIITKLKNSPSRKPIMSDLKMLFYDERFYEKLDSNVNLFCCKNGVYDLENCIFRDGRPNDYISISCGLVYESDIKKDDIRVIKMYDFLEKVFPNINNRRFFINWVSRCLKGGNFDKIFLVWTGVGDNGKSVTSNLLEKTFGKYMIKFPITTLVGGYAKSNEATSDLARAHGIRIGGFQEAPQHAHINVTKLKEITGGDSVYTRELFSKGRDTEFNMKLFLQCNHVPKAPSYDKAYYNRLRILPFESTFDQMAPSDEKEQKRTHHFPNDNNFSSHLPQLAPAFLWILIEEYKKNRLKPLIAPEEVLRAVNNYRRSNDAMMQFIEQYIVIDTNSDEGKEGLSINAIYLKYKDWFRQNFPGSMVQQKQDIQDDLKQRWGRPHMQKSVTKWIGKRWRHDDEDDDTVINSKDNISMPSENSTVKDILSFYTNDNNQDPFTKPLDDILDITCKTDESDNSASDDSDDTIQHNSPIST